MGLSIPVLVGVLVAATLVAIAAKRAQIPYSVALVVGGMGIAVTGVLPELPRLDPEIVFLIGLPVLLFEGGISSDLDSIRRNAVPIGLLAILGTGLTIAVTGVTLHAWLALPWGGAMLLSALLGGTDTVSILYTFRRVAAPSRLSSIMEGETLFNDGATLVAYAAIAAVVTGAAPPSAPGIAGGILTSTLGGVAIGLGIGLIGSLLIRRTGDPLAELMATTAIAYGAYTAANALDTSGAIAAVTAGLAVGLTMRRHLAAQSRIAINSFWQYVTFGVNTFLFLTIGFTTSPGSIGGHLREIATGFACVVLGRAAAIYLVFLGLRILRPALAVPFKWQHVFVFGNIKGALAVALALGLPAEMPMRGLVVDVAFGVAFVSLVGQGLLLSGFVRWLGLSYEEPVVVALGEQQARLIAARAARQELDSLHAAGLVPRAGYDLLRSDYQVTIAESERSLRTLQERHLAHGARLLLATRRRLVDAERAAVLQSRRSGLIPEGAAAGLLVEIDERVLRLERVLAGEAPLEEAPPGAGGPGEER